MYNTTNSPPVILLGKGWPRMWRVNAPQRAQRFGTSEPRVPGSMDPEIMSQAPQVLRLKCVPGIPWTQMGSRSPRFWIHFLIPQERPKRVRTTAFSLPHLIFAKTLGQPTNLSKISILGGGYTNVKNSIFLELRYTFNFWLFFSAKNSQQQLWLPPSNPLKNRPHPFFLTSCPTLQFSRATSLYRWTHIWAIYKFSLDNIFISSNS